MSPGWAGSALHSSSLGLKAGVVSEVREHVSQAAVTTLPACGVITEPSLQGSTLGLSTFFNSDLPLLALSSVPFSSIWSFCLRV